MKYMETGDQSFIDRRKYQRSEFAYPVEIKIFLPFSEQLSFSGYIENISMSGACIYFEDKYGRINLGDLSASRVKISICMPRGENITVLSCIKWIRKDKPKRLYVQIGIEFENLESWQSDEISKLISLKNKDQNMMWSLWEQYERQL